MQEDSFPSQSASSTNYVIWKHRAATSPQTAEGLTKKAHRLIVHGLKRRKTIIRLGIGLLSLYAGTYVALSVQGQYTPSLLGYGHVKSYAWSPIGFTSDVYGVDYNQVVLIAFLPLWLVDHHFFHTPEKALDREYRINTKLSEAYKREAKQASTNIDTDRAVAVQPITSEESGK